MSYCYNNNEEIKKRKKTVFIHNIKIFYVSI